MSDLKDWFQAAASNNATAPNGWPEGMLRSDVNNTGRETHAAVKRYYDNPDFRRPFENFTIARTNGTTFTITNGTVESNASTRLEAGQRIRTAGNSGGDSGKTWEGWVTSATQVSNVCTVVIEWIASVSADTTGPTQNVTYFEVGLKEIGKAAWYDTGASAGNIPLYDDLEAHVVKAENTLDVGFLDGQTREEIAVSSARGRLNANGGFDVWQRGTSFTGSTTGLLNSDGNLTADCWAIISDGADRGDYERSADAPAGATASMKITSRSTNNHGLVSIVEPSDAIDIADPGVSRKISASFKAKYDSSAAGTDTIRVYLLNIKTTSPGDPVQTWNSAGSDFTPSTNWEIIASAQVTLTTSWQEFKPFTNVDPNVSGVGNGGIAIAFHIDEGTISNGAIWYLAQVQINEGEKNLPFLQVPFSEEMRRCQRYCETTFPNQQQPGNNLGNQHSLAAVSSGVNVVADWRFREEKYATPSIAYYNPGDASPGSNYWEDQSSTARAVSSSELSPDGAHIYCTTATTATVHRVGAYVYANIWGNN